MKDVKDGGNSPIMNNANKTMAARYLEIQGATLGLKGLPANKRSGIVDQSGSHEHV